MEESTQDWLRRAANECASAGKNGVAVLMRKNDDDDIVVSSSTDAAVIAALGQALAGDYVPETTGDE